MIGMDYSVCLAQFGDSFLPNEKRTRQVLVCHCQVICLKKNLESKSGIKDLAKLGILE